MGAPSSFKKSAADHHQAVLLNGHRRSVYNHRQATMDHHHEDRNHNNVGVNNSIVDGTNDSDHIGSTNQHINVPVHDNNFHDDAVYHVANNNKENSSLTFTSLIQQYLAVMCVENATFLAERFVATSKTSDSLYLLALCHYRSGSPQRAMCVLEDCPDPTPNAQYLLAKCCYDLEQYGRAEEALLQVCRAEYRQVGKAGGPVTSELFSPMEEWILATSPCPIPNGAAGLYLLGDICRKSNRKGRAITYYRMSLQLDPLLWSSFQALCELGAENVDPTSVFGVRPSALETGSSQFPNRPLQERTVKTPTAMSSSKDVKMTSNINANDVTGGNVANDKLRLPQSIGGLGTPSNGTANGPTNSSRTFHFYPTSTSTNPFGVNNDSSTTKNNPRFQTPGLTPIAVNASMAHETPPVMQHTNNPQTNSEVPTNNPYVIRRAKYVAARMYYQPTPETPHTADIRTSLQYLRGLGRTATKSTETPLRRGGNNNSVMSSMARKPRALFLSSDNKNINNEPEDIIDDEDDEKLLLGKLEEVKTSYTTGSEGVQQILELLALLGSAWQKLCQYRCREALQIFQILPHSQQNTGWVLHQQGRAYFEMNDFQNAQRCLELMQTVEPHRMKGLDLLSTVFWQLKKEVEIAHLAQRVVDFDRMCPEAWCVVGNCFSLQKEHETALVFFKRSLQLDPSFTYTHTLSGYEYMANEDFDKAVGCFRSALRADERHYNAWYGLGAIYHRQEKYDLAEYHFERAVQINPQSSVLRCNLGIAQYSNGKAFQALDTLAEAFRLDPRNPQARFQRATIYSAMNRPVEALAELEKVRDAAPREATVHFAMGRMLKRLGRPEQAMKCFLTAMDLDPKDNQLIKSAMDKLDEPDVDEEVAAF